MIKTATYDTKVFTSSAIQEVVKESKIKNVKSEYTYSYDKTTKIFQFDVKYK